MRSPGSVRDEGSDVLVYSDSARISLGKEEVVDGNLSLESRGFDSLPVKANHQPEASLACECGNALLEA